MEHYRSYEISLWTLQDSFITVLKPSNLELKGQTQNPSFNIKDDGEDHFSFKIPMYLRNEEKNASMENPIWYTTRNGNLIVNMRKVKVIFNKMSADERVFEFVITKVTENHDGFTKYCEVECEGLAFHELGKQGYKISLSLDELLIDQEAWEKNPVGARPVANINYWCDKIFDGSSWDYSIRMDWSSYDGIIDATSNAYDNLSVSARNSLNAKREAQGLRRRDKVYEDSYVEGWTEQNGKLIPSSVAEQQEKYRIVEESESNRYNLTQSVAEIFQVFCKYVYYYDDNYHIVGREVVFFNNFLNESDGTLDFTYYYNTKSLKREMDSTETVTKMYVKELSDANTPTGEVTIMDTTANKAREDYLLNFDYFYNIGTINEEQYAEIDTFTKQVNELNVQLMALEEDIFKLEEELPEQEATRDNAEQEIDLDTQNIASANDQLNSLTNGTGKIPVTEAAPQTYFLLSSNNGTYMIKLNTSGILDDKTLRVYGTYNTTTHKFDASSEYKSFTRVKDKYGNITQLTNIKRNESLPNPSKCYLTYTYRPELQYENMRSAYEKKLAQDKIKYNNAAKRVKEINSSLKTKQAKYDELLAQKKALVNAFERLMGPALREGTWQPEDSYTNYGTNYSQTFSIALTSKLNSNLFSFGWDSETFDDEQLNYYFYSINEDKTYYPCINLSSLVSKFSNEDVLQHLSFIYNDIDYDSIDDPRGMQYMTIGAGAQLAFLRQKNGSGNVIPVLMLTDIEGRDTSKFTNHARLGIVNVTTDGAYTVTVNTIASSVSFVSNLSNYNIVYPRIQINSLYLKRSEDELFLKHGTEILDSYEDYYVLRRDSAYYLTIKPEKLFSYGNITEKFTLNYEISNSALAIYLDALQVLKENSYPKVSYEISSSFVDVNLVRTIYNRLGQIARINDNELKFDNVMGYISELNLNLDKPSEDTIVIKNYKTKFEDLFSSIVAQTDSMKKNSYLTAITANAFTASGGFNQQLFQESLGQSNLSTVLQDSTVKNSLAAINNNVSNVSTTIRTVSNGEVGLNFAGGNGITTVILNNERGLYMQGSLDGTHEGIFQVTNGNMGFYKINGDQIEKLLYFENGNLMVSGVVLASAYLLNDAGTAVEIGEAITEVITGNVEWEDLQRALEAEFSDEYATKAELNNIKNGTTGLSFTSGTNIKTVLLNKTDGLKMTRSDNRYFQVSNGSFGFFDENNNGIIYYDETNKYGVVKGKIMAETGWLGNENGLVINDDGLTANNGQIIIDAITPKFLLSKDNVEYLNYEDGALILHDYTSTGEVNFDTSTFNLFHDRNEGDNVLVSGENNSVNSRNMSANRVYSNVVRAKELIADNVRAYQDTLYFSTTLSAGLDKLQYAIGDKNYNTIVCEIVDTEYDNRETPIYLYNINANQLIIHGRQRVTDSYYMTWSRPLVFINCNCNSIKIENLLFDCEGYPAVSLQNSGKCFIKNCWVRKATWCAVSENSQVFWSADINEIVGAHGYDHPISSESGVIGYCSEGFMKLTDNSIGSAEGVIPGNDTIVRKGCSIWINQDEELDIRTSEEYEATEIEYQRSLVKTSINASARESYTEDEWNQNVCYQGSYEEELYTACFRFNLSSIPSAAEIQNIKLVLYNNGSGIGKLASTTLYCSAGSWRVIPQTGGLTSLGSYTNAIPSYGNYTFDLTSNIDDILNSTYILAATSDDVEELSENFVNFSAAELIIEYLI